MNFRASQQVDAELEKFFSRARKSALKLTYNNFPSFSSTNVLQINSDLRNSSDVMRRGLKSQENKSRVRRPFEALKNNTRYCVSRERGREHATFLVDASSKAIKTLIEKEEKKQNKRSSNKMALQS